ncbi:hypothetical protein C8F04DRAFT_150224 [Mycena alexandri]|uniref:DUF6535 domain-containing protein n=1 Tax=Mycena alexandri TaxID=1745969 RepID=A0AAD6WTZ3_9AGAR|nr:hypothetical protein C8F04DRAFT_150224 [Mycena alexandri]
MAVGFPASAETVQPISTSQSPSFELSEGPGHAPEALHSEEAQNSIYTRLALLMEEQNVLLRRMDQRQAAADISQQPMPEVPATSSSAWNALLRSALTDTIQPQVDRWRSGLDALLVFLGLFSGIVTAFFVGSLSTLQPDPTARTNELLANLTDIVISLGGNPSLNVAQPAIFHPDRTDVRLNSLWALSLVLSLTLAALAVVCRGFLNMAAFSRDAKASNKLVDIKSRWVATERILGTSVESLPLFLIVPVLLFIIGLLDTLFSSALPLSPAPAPILVASGISLFFFCALISFLFFTAVDSSLNPTTSPFQTTFSQIFHQRLRPALSSLFSKLHQRPLSVGYTFGRPTETDALSFIGKEEAYKLSLDAKVYHEVIQTTHDDDSLDHASAALFEVLKRSIHPAGYGPRIGPLANEEHATFLHLLTPEASMRSSRTAAQVIIRLHADYLSSVSYSDAQVSDLVPALAEAAKRSCLGNTLSALWDSPFLRAMSVIVDPDLALRDHAPAVWVLASSYASWDHLPSKKDETSRHGAVLSLLLKVVMGKLLEALVNSTRATEPGIVDSILSPQFDLGEPLNLRHLLSAMLHVPSHDDLTLLVLWLFRISSSRTIIVAAYENVEDVATEQLAHLGAGQSEMFPTIVATIGQVALAQENFADHELLLQLCNLTVFKAIPEQERFTHPRMRHELFNLFDTLLTVANASPLPLPGSTLMNDLIVVREVLATFLGGSTDMLPSIDLPGTVKNAEIEHLLGQFASIHTHGMRELPTNTDDRRLKYISPHL